MPTAHAWLTVTERGLEPESVTGRKLIVLLIKGQTAAQRSQPEQAPGPAWVLPVSPLCFAIYFTHMPTLSTEVAYSMKHTEQT